MVFNNTDDLLKKADISLKQIGKEKDILKLLFENNFNMLEYIADRNYFLDNKTGIKYVIKNEGNKRIIQPITARCINPNIDEIHFSLDYDVSAKKKLKLFLTQIKDAFLILEKHGYDLGFKTQIYDSEALEYLISKGGNNLSNLEELIQRCSLKPDIELSLSSNGDEIKRKMFGIEEDILTYLEDLKSGYPKYNAFKRETTKEYTLKK